MLNEIRKTFHSIPRRRFDYLEFAIILLSCLRFVAVPSSVLFLCINNEIFHKFQILNFPYIISKKKLLFSQIFVSLSIDLLMDKKFLWKIFSVVKIMENWHHKNDKSKLSIRFYCKTLYSKNKTSELAGDSRYNTGTRNALCSKKVIGGRNKSGYIPGASRWRRSIEQIKDILSRRITPRRAWVRSSQPSFAIPFSPSCAFSLSVPLSCISLSFFISLPLRSFFLSRAFALSASNLSIKNFVAPRSQRHFVSLNGNPAGRVAGGGDREDGEHS